MGGGRAPRSREGWGADWSSAPTRGASSGAEAQGLWPSADDTLLVPQPAGLSAQEAQLVPSLALASPEDS